MKKIIITAIIVALGAIGTFATASQADDGKNSKMKAMIKKTGESKSKIAIKGVPNKGMYANFGDKENPAPPWKLRLTPGKGVKLQKTQFKLADINRKNATFSVNAMGKGTVGYEAVVFVCNVKKTECFREAHKGQFVIK